MISTVNEGTSGLPDALEEILGRAMYALGLYHLSMAIQATDDIVSKLREESDRLVLELESMRESMFGKALLPA